MERQQAPSVDQHSPQGLASLASTWLNAIPQAPVDQMFGLTAAYRADASPKKVDLGVGAYRDNDAKPYILPAVKKVSLNQSRE